MRAVEHACQRYFRPKGWLPPGRKADALKRPSCHDIHIMKYAAGTTLPILSLLLSLGLVLTVAACSGGTSASPNTPTSVPSPIAVVQATATPSEIPPTAEPVNEPTPEPTATPAPEPTPIPAAPVNTPTAVTSAPPPQRPAGSSTVVIVAELLAYDRTTITVPANTQVTITMQNNDPGIGHDVQVIGRGGTDTCTGPCSRSVTLNSGPPARYVFLCSLHPTMRGTFIVQ